MTVTVTSGAYTDNTPLTHVLFGVTLQLGIAPISRIALTAAQENTFFKFPLAVHAGTSRQLQTIVSTRPRRARPAFATQLVRGAGFGAARQQPRHSMPGQPDNSIPAGRCRFVRQHVLSCGGWAWRRSEQCDRAWLAGWLLSTDSCYVLCLITRSFLLPYSRIDATTDSVVLTLFTSCAAQWRLSSYQVPP